jgi:hypothetical protein
MHFEVRRVLAALKAADVARHLRAQPLKPLHKRRTMVGMTLNLNKSTPLEVALVDDHVYLKRWCHGRWVTPSHKTRNSYITTPTSW